MIQNMPCIFPISILYKFAGRKSKCSKRGAQMVIKLPEKLLLIPHLCPFC